jgi:hypothetical protein
LFASLVFAVGGVAGVAGVGMSVAGGVLCFLGAVLVGVVSEMGVFVGVLVFAVASSVLGAVVVVGFVGIVVFVVVLVVGVVVAVGAVGNAGVVGVVLGLVSAVGFAVVGAGVVATGSRVHCTVIV